MASFNKSLDKSRSEKLKHDRMQEVRRQEHEWSKKVVNDYKTSTIQQKQIDEREKAKQVYQQKLAELEKIKVLKEEALLQIGEAQRKAAEQAAIVEQQNQLRKKKMEETQKMAQSRYYEAQEWQKSKWQETEEGKHQARVKHLQETFVSEKQKEKSLVMTYKQNQSQVAQQDYSNLLEKNKKAPLRPEDFAKTCFHNPVSVRHDLDEQKENAYEKANSVFIESQSQLEQTAKMWREQERLSRERGLKAISKERTKKVMEDMEQETKFLKQHLLEENMKVLKSPFMKKATKPKTTQEKLSKEFDKLFVEESKPKSGVKESRRTSMQSSVSKPKSRSLSKFQKQPLDSGLYKRTQTTDRQDYMEYPLTSPDQNKHHTDIDESNEKRKVKFQVPASQSFGNSERDQGSKQNTDVYVDSLKQSKNKLNMLVQQQEQMQDDDDDDDIMSNVQSQQLQETISINTSPTQFQQYQPQQPQRVSEIKSYIQEQEDYLAKLEQERKRITETMRQDEQQLMRTLKETNKLIVFVVLIQKPNNSEIPEEESNADDDNNQLTSSGKYFQESENTYKNLYETDDQSQLTSKQPLQINQSPSYVSPQLQFGKQTLRDTNRSPDNRKTMQQTFGNQYTFQGAMQNSAPANHQSEGSPSAYEYSPESKDYSNKKDDNIDTDEIMRRFLRPQLNNPAQDNLNKFIQKQQQKQQRQKSPESELSYKFSELGQSNEKNQPLNQELILIQDQSPDKSVENYEDDDDKESPHFDNYPPPKQSGFIDIEDEDAPKGSLSEIFHRRRAELNRRFQEKQKPADEPKPKVEKTKQELMEIRKNMMKRQKKHEEETESLPVQQPTPTLDKKAKLMQRLAQGQRAQVENSEMYALTQKNYGQLPEVLKKKQQQEKMEDFKRRQEKVKELDKQTRSKLNK